MWKFPSLPFGDEKKHLSQELHQEKQTGVTNLMPRGNFQPRIHFKPFWGWFEVSRDRTLCAAHLSRHSSSNQSNPAPHTARGTAPKPADLYRSTAAPLLQEIQEIQQQFLSSLLKALQNITEGCTNRMGLVLLRVKKPFLGSLCGFRCATARPKNKRTTRLLGEPKLS